MWPLPHYGRPLKGQTLRRIYVDFAADSQVVVTARSRKPNTGERHINQATFDTESGDPATDEGLKMIWNADVLGDQGQTGKMKGVGGLGGGSGSVFSFFFLLSQPSLNSTVSRGAS
ncbi:hypothetical protein CSAL01_01394 [Colletotrichum salicis]|uniref:Uncharacterized protein n=1 Tax=Colletotrichum salicis TaxID=1209931 RepID=A0A135SWZ3_9PEZI|nr:hypothetical protein CSAL01_01394 [Colletotrichum salicis]